MGGKRLRYARKGTIILVASETIEMTRSPNKSRIDVAYNYRKKLRKILRKKGLSESFYEVDFLRIGLILF